MTLLIKNVQVLGGARKFSEGSDVFVSGDKISALGNFPNKAADVVLDGQGAYLSPGFIDVNTDSDHYLTLFDHPAQEDFLRQGVTTIFGGMCGSSLAPLFYGTLESVRKWGGSEDKINVNWHTLGEFLAELDRKPLGVNFGTMVGHATIRRAIVGDDLRELTKNELNVFRETLMHALKEGGFGLSTGLGYVHARKTPYAELRALAGIVKEMNGVYATHLRDAGTGIEESLDETIRLARETGASTLVSHFVPLMRAKKEYSAALKKINALPPEFDFRFDIYPSAHTLVPLYTFLPVWAQTGGLEVMLASVKDAWMRDRIKKDMEVADDKAFVVAQAIGNDFLVGKTLNDIKQRYELCDARDAILKLMETTGLKGTIFYGNLDAPLIKKAIASGRSLIASNAPSFADEKSDTLLKSERTTSTFTQFLALAEKEKLMPLADAVKKITIEPAKLFGLAGRGEIKEGNFADLTCFRNGEIKFTVVNGKVAMRDGAFEGTPAGVILRHRPGKSS